MSNSDDGNGKFLQYAMVGVGGIAGVVVIALLFSIVMRGTKASRNHGPAPLEPVQPVAVVPPPVTQPIAVPVHSQQQIPQPVAIAPQPPPPSPPAIAPKPFRLGTLEGYAGTLLAELRNPRHTTATIAQSVKPFSTELASLGGLSDLNATSEQEKGVFQISRLMQETLVDYELVINAHLTTQSQLPSLEQSYRQLLETQALDSGGADALSQLSRQSRNEVIQTIELTLSVIKKGYIAIEEPVGVRLAATHGVEYVNLQGKQKGHLLGPKSIGILKAKCTSLCEGALLQIQEARQEAQ